MSTKRIHFGAPSAGSPAPRRTAHPAAAAFSWPPREDEVRGCEIVDVDNDTGEPVLTDDALQEAAPEPVFFDPPPPRAPEPSGPVEFVPVDPKAAGNFRTDDTRRDPAEAFARVLGSAPSAAKSPKPREERRRASLAVFGGILCALLSYLDYRTLDKPLIPGSDEPSVAELPEPARAPLPRLTTAPSLEAAADRVPTVKPTAPLEVAPPHGEVTHAALRVVESDRAERTVRDAPTLRAAAADAGADVRTAVIKSRPLEIDAAPQVVTATHAGVDDVDRFDASAARTDDEDPAAASLPAGAPDAEDAGDDDEAAPPAADFPSESREPEATSTRRNPTIPTLTDEERIRSTLMQFRTAYAQLNAQNARRVWPTVDTVALSRAFRSLRSQDLLFEHCDLDVQGKEASAACRGLATYVPRIGSQKPRTDRREWNFTLKKIEDQWAITAAHVR